MNDFGALSGYAIQVTLEADCQACGQAFPLEELKTVAREYYCRGCVPDEEDAFGNRLSGQRTRRGFAIYE